MSDILWKLGHRLTAARPILPMIATPLLDSWDKMVVRWTNWPSSMLNTSSGVYRRKMGVTSWQDERTKTISSPTSQKRTIIVAYDGDGKKGK